jgi:hypothetical protein
VAASMPLAAAASTRGGGSGALLLSRYGGSGGFGHPSARHPLHPSPFAASLSPAAEPFAHSLKGKHPKIPKVALSRPQHRPDTAETTAAAGSQSARMAASAPLNIRPHSGMRRPVTAATAAVPLPLPSPPVVPPPDESYDGTASSGLAHLYDADGSGGGGGGGGGQQQSGRMSRVRARAGRRRNRRRDEAAAAMAGRRGIDSLVPGAAAAAAALHRLSAAAAAASRGAGAAAGAMGPAASADGERTRETMRLMFDAGSLKAVTDALRSATPVERTSVRAVPDL